MNQIANAQETPSALRLLRARRRVFNQINWVQGIYILISFIIPLVSINAAHFWPSIKPWISPIALLVGAIDAVLITSWTKDQLKLSAQLQERFDCEILEIPRNDFVAGSPVGAEEIERLGANNLRPKAEALIHNWYPVEVQGLTVSQARLVCQRTNLWYDGQLRHTYRFAIVGIAVLLFGTMLISAMANNYNVNDFILTIIVPFGPFFMWVVREYQRQGDTLRLIERLKSEIQKSIAGLLSLEHSQATARSRELQDAIYAHRASSPIVLSLIYRIRRRKLESQMKAGAKDFVEQVKKVSVPEGVS